MTKEGGESKEGDTVVADAGMKESQSEEDDSSDWESFGDPDSPELPKGVEESFDDGDKKEEDQDLENAPAATNHNSDWDYSRCNTCKHLNDPRQNALSPHATETYEDSPIPWEEAWELFSWHIPDGIWKLDLKPSYHLVRVMEVCTRYFGGIVEGNYPIDQSQHALQEIRRRMKGEPKAVSQMIAVEDQIMSLKMV